MHRVWIDFLRINYKNKNSYILYYPFIGCGYANKIPTLVSSLFLSLVSFHPIYIVSWPQLLFYLYLPKSIFIHKYNLTNVKVYNGKNKSILNLLKENVTVKIFNYHSYTKDILCFYYLTYKLNLLIKGKKNKIVALDNVLNLIFLKPKENINKYINHFIRITKKDYIVGIHIRTGYLSDFGEKGRIFFNNNSTSLYIYYIKRVVKMYNKCKIFIISDSTVTKEYFSILFKNRILNYSIPGKICHAKDTMHSGATYNQCVVKLIAENYILSKCNILIGSGRSTYFAIACKRGNIKCITI